MQWWLLVPAELVIVFILYMPARRGEPVPVEEGGDASCEWRGEPVPVEAKGGAEGDWVG